MIEMNLMDSPSYIVGNYLSGDEKKNAGVFVLIAVIVLIPLGSIYLVRSISGDKVTNEKENYSVKIEPSDKIRTKNESVVEEIVDSVSAVVKKSVVNKSYENMAKWEQMDYEVKFNALAFEEFSNITPPEITFGEIRIFDYKTLIAEGTAPNRESASKLLNGLKASGWDLHPKPRTNIRDGGTFYYFHIEADFFLSTADLLKNPINPENKPKFSRLNEVKDKIVRSARTSQLKTNGLNLEKSVNEPNEKIYTYNIKFEGNFQNILNFIKLISVMEESVRCENITLKYKPKTIEGTAKIAITLL